MDLDKLVSVIVPCYNQALYLPETLQSVLDQTYPHWECIIVNDGSSDNTEEIAKEWCSKDNRFIYVKKENGGLSSARNAGLQIAKGDYIQFLDSDDTIVSSKFEKQLSHFKDNVDIVITDYFPYDQENGLFLRRRSMNPFPDLINYKRDVIIKWESELSIPCHCVIFKSTLLHQDEALLFNEYLPNHEDWTFWVQLFYYSKGIFNLKEALANYRIHNQSMCADQEKMNQGFIKACEFNINFFNKKNDKPLKSLCEQKLNLIQGVNTLKYNNLKVVLSLFIPPILFKLKNKIFKK